jgi:STAS-like domain of unknown function (DUF4325)
MNPTSTSSGGKQVISLADLGPDVSGRELGESIRERVIPGTDEVVFDCAGIETMSPSFADELFGKLAVQEDRPAHLRVANASPDVTSVVRFAVRERQGEGS